MTGEWRNEMIFQDAPANTMNYMIAGYAVIFSVMLVYMISLVVRKRNLEREVKELEEMERKR
jgi:CcmD family protein